IIVFRKTMGFSCHLAAFFNNIKIHGADIECGSLIFLMINYNGKIFSPIENTANGESGSETVFVFRQTGKILTSNYSGGKIVRGHILALVDDEGCLEMTYHHINTDRILMTGTCRSIPE